jgi:hypothetical protein
VVGRIEVSVPFLEEPLPRGLPLGLEFGIGRPGDERH